MRAAHDMSFKEFNCSEAKTARDSGQCFRIRTRTALGGGKRGQSRRFTSRRGGARWRASALSNLRSRSHPP